MAGLLTIPQIIAIGRASTYLSLNYSASNVLWGARIVQTPDPVNIALFTAILKWQYDQFPPISEVNATGSVLVDDIGDDGDAAELFIDDPEFGEVSMGVYLKDSAETTTTLVAAAMATEWNNNTYGYLFSNVANEVVIEARTGLGATMNIGSRIRVEITPNSFSPIDIANLWGWYDASVGVAGTTSVTAWADQSGNSRNLFSAVAPKLTPNVINSLPVIEPNTGVGARMLPSANFPIGDFTIFIVGSQSITGAPLTDTDGVFLYSAANDLRISRSVSANEIAGAVFGLTKPATNGTFYTIRNQYLTTGSNGYYLALNNGTVGYLAASSSTSADQLLVFDDGFNSFGNKQIAEIIIYTRALNSGEIAQVETYLQDKYNHY